MEPGDPPIRELVASVAGSIGDRLAAVTGDIQDVIEHAIPGLRRDETAMVLHASVGENVDVALQILAGAGGRTVAAPSAADDYARVLAQHDVPATALIRAYRVGQARFLRHCTEELLRQSPGDHLEGLATLEMTESVSEYVDHVVEEARAVALAAGDERAPITPFVDVAPIAMLFADLGSARAWIHETLGDLAIGSTRNEGLRDTARVFLQTGGSYTARAEQLFLHRNTAQYRVRKAEEVRGRPLRDGRLGVGLALLPCHWLKAAVLQQNR